MIELTHNGEAPARSVPPVKDDSFGILQLSRKFLPKHPTRNKIGRPKAGLWPLTNSSIKVLTAVPIQKFLLGDTNPLRDVDTDLHDDQGDAAEADGGLEGGHGLGVGQAVQTGLIHAQQQVPLLKTRAHRL